MSWERAALWALYILGGYLLGGILFARLLPLILRGTDICRLSDDGNPGVFNVFTLCGKAMGLACLALELGKAFLPVWAARRVLPTDDLLFAAVVAAPVLGHATAPFDRCVRGGKAISASFGALLGLVPECLAVWWLAAVYISLSIFPRVPSHRRRSILTFALFAAGSVGALCLRGKYALALGCALVAAIVIVRHIQSPDDAPDQTRAAA